MDLKDGKGVVSCHGALEVNQTFSPRQLIKFCPKHKIISYKTLLNVKGFKLHHQSSYWFSIYVFMLGKEMFRFVPVKLENVGKISCVI